MRVTVPTTITDAMLTSTNVTEDDYGVWDVSTDYAAEEYVIVTGTTHKIYRAVQASGPSTAVVDPTTDTDSSHWLEVSATNRWKPFDGRTSVQCERADSIQYVFDSVGLVDGVALHGLAATTVNLTIVADAVEVYNEDIDLADSSVVLTAYDYYFEPVTYRDRTEFTDVPPYTDATLTLTISNTGLTAKVGQIVIGRKRTFGDAVFSPRLGLLDFSTKERDAFGNPYILEREFAQTVEYKVSVLNANTGYVFRLLSGLRATGASWSAGDDTEQLGLSIFGYLEDFDELISNPAVTELSLKVQEL